MSVQIDTETQEVKQNRALYENSGSAVLSIPPAVLRQAGIGPGSEVEIAIGFEDSTIELRPVEDAQQEQQKVEE